MSKPEKVAYDLDYILLQEKIFNITYIMHLRKNPHASEKEYLKYSISDCEKSLENYLTNTNDDKASNISNCENLIKYYDFKLKKIMLNENSETTNKNEEQEEKIPYKIALLKELGFFDLDSIKNRSKENQYKIIHKLLGGTLRTVKGNVLVLNPNSKEDQMKYTANNHLENVKDYLDKLK
jgi:hypothetical protein